MRENLKEARKEAGMTQQQNGISCSKILQEALSKMAKAK